MIFLVTKINIPYSREMEQFMQDLEHDPDMRQNVNLFKGNYR